MGLISGLKKVFAKRDRFASPNKYMLTSREREAVIVFFSLMSFALIILIVLLAVY